MKSLYSTALGFLAAATIAFSAVPAIPTGPWKQVFNGKDLNNGWSNPGNPPFSITGGILSFKGGTTKTFMVWNEPIKDLELEATYKLSTPNANSGIQIRSHCLDRTKTPPTCGGTYQICGPQLDVAKDYSGRLFEECVAFLQFDGQDIDNCRRTLAIGAWTTATARIDGPNVSVWLNGAHCLDYVLTKAEHLNDAIFALQSHPPFDLIEWNSIKIRKLNVPGCTNPKATNYNAEATKDDGTCIVPVANMVATQNFAKSIKVSASTVTYSLPEAGNYLVRLVDLHGIVAKEVQGNGPAMDGKMELPGQGIYFLEVTLNGIHSRHKVYNF